MYRRLGSLDQAADKGIGRFVEHQAEADLHAVYAHIVGYHAEFDNALAVAGITYAPQRIDYKIGI